MKITIGFSTHRGFNLVSALIRLVEKTEFSHMYVKLDLSSLDRVAYYEASGTAVHFKANKLWNDSNVVVREFVFDVSDDSYRKVMQFCVDNAGVSYGLKSLLGFGIVYLGRAIGRKWSNPFRDGRETYVCSEVAMAVLDELGYDCPPEDDVTPKSAYEFMESKFGKN